jgi:hypothetical protein
MCHLSDIAANVLGHRMFSNRFQSNQKYFLELTPQFILKVVLGTTYFNYRPKTGVFGPG